MLVSYTNICLFSQNQVVTFIDIISGLKLSKLSKGLNSLFPWRFPYCCLNRSNPGDDVIVSKQPIVTT